MRCRTALYVPAGNTRAVARAPEAPCDLVILDLEDSVAPERKAEAREAAADAVRGLDRPAMLRVNGLWTAWGAEDLQAARACGAHAVLIPKIETVGQAAAAVQAAAGLEAWLMMETPGALMSAGLIACLEGVRGLVAGWNDFALACGMTVSDDRRELWAAMGTLVCVGRAADVPVLDGVPLALRDAGATRAEARQARAFGFDGKTLVHPDQIAPTAEGFAPDEGEREAAGALLAAWEARAQGAGVIAHEGRLVEALHAQAARRLLA